MFAFGLVSRYHILAVVSKDKPEVMNRTIGDNRRTTSEMCVHINLGFYSISYPVHSKETFIAAPIGYLKSVWK